jgi:hypothetical protein
MTFIVLIIAKYLLSYKLATKKTNILDFGYLFPAFYGFDQVDAALRI